MIYQALDTQWIEAYIHSLLSTFLLISCHKDFRLSPNLSFKPPNPSPKVRVQELNEELQAAKDSAKASRGRENSLKEEVDSLNQDLQRSQKTQRRLQAEKEEREQETQELKQQIKRLSSALQVSICKECGKKKTSYWFVRKHAAFCMQLHLCRPCWTNLSLQFTYLRPNRSAFFFFFLT